MIRPRKSRLFVRLFQVYNRRLLQRTFRCVHLDGDPGTLAPQHEAPLMVCLSHASWWDPLLALLLDEQVPELDSYGLMDAAQLRRWGFFTRLGMIGVDRAAIGETRQLLEFVASLLSRPDRALWITPQGRFASLAARPLRFQPGIGHIAARIPRFRATTVVLDYEFWDSNKPEAFVSIRPPQVYAGGPALDRAAFVHEMERRMEEHISALTALRIRRDSSLFSPLLTGRRAVAPEVAPAPEEPSGPPKHALAKSTDPATRGGGLQSVPGRRL